MGRPIDKQRVEIGGGRRLLEAEILKIFNLNGNSQFSILHILIPYFPEINL